MWKSVADTDIVGRCNATRVVKYAGMATLAAIIDHPRDFAIYSSPQWAEHTWSKKDIEFYGEANVQNMAKFYTHSSLCGHFQSLPNHLKD